MLFGVRFIDMKTGDEVHSLSDWAAAMTAPAEMPDPDADTYLLKIPGADGLLDLTESVVGDVTYGTRPIAHPFISRAPRSTWPKLHQLISNQIHGRYKKIIHDDDPDYYWLGRCYIDEWDPDGRLLYFNISTDAEPFKWEHNPVSVKAKFTEIGNMGLPVLISEGQDVSRQNWNTDLRFGTKEIPTYDFSAFEKLTFMVTPWKTTQTMQIQLVDGAGVIYNHEIAATDEKNVTIVLTKETLTGAGLDLKTVWRILCSHCPEVKLTGTPAWGVNVTLEGGKRNTAPVIEVPAGIDVAVFNGQQFGLTEGTNQLDDLELRQGENIVTFMNSENLGQTGELTVSYRRGWL